MTGKPEVNCCYQIALKTRRQGLSDNSDRIRQHGVRGQGLALIDIDRVADGGAAELLHPG